jgi:cell wall-associated NlpC family hydrolase
MSEQEQREALVAEARRWLGAKWHNDALVPYKLVDCAQLLVAVYAACGLIEKPQLERYSRQFALHQNDQRFLQIVEQYARPVDIPQPGDVAIFQVEGAVFSHGAIVTGWPWIIHAHVVAGVIQDNVELSQLADKPVRFYSVFA